jgi:hypothetical protein
MRLSVPALTTLAFLGISGCHWVFPYSSGVSTDHSGVLDSRRDGPIATSDMRLPDRCPPPDRSPVDSGCQIVNGCVECEQVVSAVAACSVQPCCHGDCDALPDLRDPWPLTCNPLVFSDDFCTSAPTKWSFQSPSTSVAGGLLWIHAPPHNTVWVGTTQTPPGGLVEARLDSYSGSNGWELAVSADGTDSTTLPTLRFRMCLLKFGAAGSSLTLENQVQAPILLTVDATTPYADRDIVLQSWVADGNHHCRAVIGGMPQDDLVQTFTSALPGSDRAVSVGVFNHQNMDPLDAKVDWVRVFARASSP